MPQQRANTRDRRRHTSRLAGTTCAICDSTQCKPTGFTNARKNRCKDAELCTGGWVRPTGSINTTNKKECESATTIGVAFCNSAQWETNRPQLRLKFPPNRRTVWTRQQNPHDVSFRYAKLLSVCKFPLFIKYWNAATFSSRSLPLSTSDEFLRQKQR